MKTFHLFNFEINILPKPENKLKFEILREYINGKFDGPVFGIYFQLGKIGILIDKW